jgi:hypothetical protein
MSDFACPGRFEIVTISTPASIRRDACLRVAQVGEPEIRLEVAPSLAASLLRRQDAIDAGEEKAAKEAPYGGRLASC